MIDTLVWFNLANQSGSSSNKEKPPSLYTIGCAGFVTAFSQTNDKRYEIILEGVCRFKIKKS